MNKSLYMALLLISASFGLNASDCEAERAHYEACSRYQQIDCDDYYRAIVGHCYKRSDGLVADNASAYKSSSRQACLLAMENRKRAEAAYQQCKARK